MARPDDVYPLRCSTCSADLGASIAFPSGRDPCDRLAGYYCEACAPARAEARTVESKAREEARALELLEKAADVLAAGLGPEDVRARLREKLELALGVGSLRDRIDNAERLATAAMVVADEKARAT
jgi:hypothetical protein